MSALLARLEHGAMLHSGEGALAKAAAQMRRSKIFFGVLLAVLLWFSVPYSLPRHLPNAATAIATADNAEQFEGSLSRQLAVPAMGLIACYLLWRLPHRARLQGRLRWAVLAYVVLIAASALWSDDPALTVKRLTVFGTDCLFAYTLAVTTTAMELAVWAMCATFVTGIISLGADIFALKLFAPFDPDYRLTGVMTANYQAMNLLVCCLCTAVLMLRRPRWLPWLSVVLGVAFALLVLTRSRMATIIGLVLLIVVMLRVLRERVVPERRALVQLAALAAGLPLLVFIGGQDLRGAAQGAFMMGRSDTQNTASLSNRLPLWTELMLSVQQRPWLGFGYGAFWNQARAGQISSDQGWPVPNAHDTYLDQVIILGWPGGLLYTATVLCAVSIAWRRYRQAYTPADLLNALLLTWMALLSTAESTPLEPHLPTLMAYVALLRMCLRQQPANEQNNGEAAIIETATATVSVVPHVDVPQPRVRTLPPFPSRRLNLETRT
jgi:exopolysaccharide production protein ExoQ